MPPSSPAGPGGRRAASARSRPVHRPGPVAPGAPSRLIALRTEVITVIVFINGRPGPPPAAAIHTGDRQHMRALKMAALRPPAPRAVLITVATIAAPMLAAACSAGPGTAPAANSTATINAVGAENQYANVISQVGGRYVHVSAVESNPNTDPHTFEASASVAQLISQRRPGRAERPRLRHVHDQDRVRGPQWQPPGYRRAAPAGAAGQHAQPAPVVQAFHDAGGREGRGRRTCRPSSLPTRRISPPGLPPSTGPCGPGIT